MRLASPHPVEPDPARMRIPDRRRIEPGTGRNPGAEKKRGPESSIREADRTVQPGVDPEPPVSAVRDVVRNRLQLSFRQGGTTASTALPGCGTLLISSS